MTCFSRLAASRPTDSPYLRLIFVELILKAVALFGQITASHATTFYDERDKSQKTSFFRHQKIPPKILQFSYHTWKLRQSRQPQDGGHRRRLFQHVQHQTVSLNQSEEN